MGDFETLPHKTTQNLKSKIMACPMPPKTPRPTPAPRVPSPLMTRIVNEAVDAQELNARITEIVADGTPLIEQAYYDDGTANENERIVTFLYQHATAEQVLIFVNRLTDEKNLPLSLMERIPGTDWWELSFQMRTDWRASYNFIPTLPGERPIWLGEDDQVTLRTALDSGEGDPLNPKTVCNRIGRCMGVVELADAPVHEFLLTQQELDSLPEPHWMSTADGHQYLLGRVGNPSPDSPLFILFDGEVWYGHGMEHMLNRACAAGRIPDMNVFFLHSGGRRTPLARAQWRQPHSRLYCRRSASSFEASSRAAARATGYYHQRTILRRAVFSAGGFLTPRIFRSRNCPVVFTVAAPSFRQTLTAS